MLRKKTPQTMIFHQKTSKTIDFSWFSLSELSYSKSQQPTCLPRGRWRRRRNLRRVPTTEASRSCQNVLLTLPNNVMGAETEPSERSKHQQFPTVTSTVCGCVCSAEPVVQCRLVRLDGRTLFRTRKQSASPTETGASPRF